MEREGRQWIMPEVLLSGQDEAMVECAAEVIGLL